MSKQRFTNKQLIVELLEFLKSDNKKAILVEEYINRTQNSIEWTKPRIIALYKAIHETKAVTIDYFKVRKSTTKVLCLQVTRN